MEVKPISICPFLRIYTHIYAYNIYIYIYIYHTWFVKIGTIVEVKSMSSIASSVPFFAPTLASTESIMDLDLSLEKPNCTYVYIHMCAHTYVHSPWLTCIYPRRSQTARMVCIYSHMYTHTYVQIQWWTQIYPWRNQTADTYVPIGTYKCVRVLGLSTCIVGLRMCVRVHVFLNYG